METTQLVKTLAVSGVEVNMYSKYKPSGIEWLGEIPEHWEVKKLKFIAKIFNGDSLNEILKKKYSSENLEDLAYISSKDINVNDSSITYENGLRIPKDNLKLKVAPKNTSLLCIEGGSAGRKIAFTNQDVCFVNKLACFVSHQENSKYLFYSLKGNPFQKQFKLSMSGLIGGVAISSINNFNLPIPPLPEQTVIAKFLDDKTKKIDQAIGIKEQQIALLKERKQILIHKAVTGQLIMENGKWIRTPKEKMKDSGVEWIGKIPEHWEVKRLKFITQLISEKVSSKKSFLPYIGMENIESWTGKHILSDSETEGLASYFDKGDILFGKLRPYLAKVYLAEKEGICSTEFLVYRAGKQIHNFYLNLMMLSFEFINLIDSSTYGSKMPRANSDFIGNQLIPTPSLSEQEEISSYIESASQKIDTAISLKTQEIEKLKEYKSSLINSVVTGKVKII